MDTTARVMEIIREHQETPRHFGARSDLREEAGIDSFGTLMVVNAIEDTFGVTVADTDIERFRTVKDIVEVLEGVEVTAKGN